MKRLLLSVFALVFCVGIAQAAIKVSPTVVELDANKAKGNYLTTAFTVEGGKNETIRFKIYPEFFEITNNGRMDVKPGSDSLHSLINHARFVPNEFTLSNGKPQTVRVTFSDINKLPDGESRMVLFMEDVAAKEVSMPSGNSAIKSRLVVKTRVGVPIYVDKGKYTKVGQFDDLKVEKENKDLVYKIKLSTSGNSKVRYSGRAQIISGKELLEEFPVNNAVVAAMSDYSDSQKLPLEKVSQKGDYTLRVILNYKDEKQKNKTLVKETVFSIDSTEKGKL